MKPITDTQRQLFNTYIKASQQSTLEQKNQAEEAFFATIPKTLDREIIKNTISILYQKSPNDISLDAVMSHIKKPPTKPEIALFITGMLLSLLSLSASTIAALAFDGIIAASVLGPVGFIIALTLGLAASFILLVCSEMETNYQDNLKQYNKVMKTLNSEEPAPELNHANVMANLNDITPVQDPVPLPHQLISDIKPLVNGGATPPYSQQSTPSHQSDDTPTPVVNGGANPPSAMVSW
jgi:hypothetical protein